MGTPAFWESVEEARQGKEEGFAQTDWISRLPGETEKATLEGDEVRQMKTSDTERITVNPKQCGGRPCVRGMRIRVRDVLDMLAGGATEQEILKDFPDLEMEDIRACIGYAATYVDHPVLVNA